MRVKMLVCLLVCAMVLGGSLGAFGADKSKPIVIGALIPLTGALSEHGVQSTRGLNMIEAEINAAGGILGRPLKIKILDSKYKPDVAVRVADSLLYDYGAHFFNGCLLSSTTNAVSQWAKDKKKLFIGYGVSEYLTRERGHRYFFRGSCIMNIQTLGNVINMGGKGFNKLWTIAPDYAYGHQSQKMGVKLINERYPELEVIGASWPPVDEKDFSPYITKIMSSGADAIYSFLFGGTQIGFIKQATQFGLFKKVRYAGGDFSPVNVRPLGREGAEGMLGYSHYEYNLPNTPENRKFAQAYEEKYGTKAYDYSAWMYTNILMLTEAIKMAGTIDTEAVIDAMEKIKIATPFSKDTYYRTCDHNISLGAVIGATAYPPGEDFLAVQQDAKYLEPQQSWTSCEDIEKARAAKK